MLPVSSSARTSQSPLGGARFVVPGFALCTTPPPHSHSLLASSSSPLRHLSAVHARVVGVRSSNRARRSVPLPLGDNWFARPLGDGRFVRARWKTTGLHPGHLRTLRRARVRPLHHTATPFAFAACLIIRPAPPSQRRARTCYRCPILKPGTTKRAPPGEGLLVCAHGGVTHDRH